jgi:IclR family pca regulon transcriptional regulator
MSGDFVESLAKGLEVLTCFSRQTVRPTLSEVAKLTGMSPASARRSLMTLVELGYLQTDGKRFWMQPRVLLIAYAFLSSRPMPSLAQPLLDSLSQQTQESASIGQLIGEDVIIIARSTARRSLSTGLAIGSRLPVYCSSLGRVLLAGMDRSDAIKLLESVPKAALTRSTIFNQSKIWELVETCREHGWTACDGELELEVRSIAVPIRDQDGVVKAAMSIAVRAERMGVTEFRERFLGPLMRARNSLEDRMFPSRHRTKNPRT